MPASEFKALALRETADGTEVPVRVTPRAKRTAVVGLWQDAVKVNVAAPPREGKANEELGIFLAGLFGVPRRSVCITRGEKSRTKVVLIRGVRPERIRSLFAEKAGEEEH